MKLKNTILLFCSVIMLAASAQKNLKTTPDLAFEKAINKYKNAIKYSDYNTAIDAMHEVLVINPEKINYKDSLLTLYFYANRPTSAVILAKEIEAEGNSNTITNEVLATTYQKAGMFKESLPYYEKLNAANSDLYYLYQIAIIQFNLSRLKECSQSLGEIIQNPKAKTGTMAVNYEKQKPQQIPYAATAHNVLGVLAMQLKEEDKAKAQFEAALKISPDFLLAKNNLEALKK